MTRFWRFGVGLLSAAAGLLVVACGGEGGPRPDRLHGGGTPYDDATASLACPDNPYATYPACSAPDPGSGPFSCADADGYEFAMVEDFETGVASDGGWYTNNELCYRCVLMQYAPDGGVLPNSYPIVPVLDPGVCADRCETSQDPPHFQKPIPAAEIQNGGRCGSRFAMRIRAPLKNGPFTDWGVQFKRDMTGSPFDAGTPQYEGVSFWARVGPASRGNLRFSASDKFTWEKYVDPVTQTSVCLGQGRPTIDQYVDGGSTDGCDEAGTYFNVGPDWRFFALPFSEMRQAGWGKKEPYFDIWGIMGMGFLAGAGAWWDIWIDDVAWYRRKP
jgi:hypothetical protein